MKEPLTDKQFKTEVVRTLRIHQDLLEETMKTGKDILRAIQREGLVVTRFQDGKRMSDAEVADTIQKVLDKKVMTPGHRVLKAFAQRNYEVSENEGDRGWSTTDDSEIAGIIEQESGITKLVEIIRDLISNNATRVEREKVEIILEEMGL